MNNIGDSAADADAIAIWDVFVSHSHTDEATAGTIATSLAESGLRVFRAVGAVDAFTSISSSVMNALRHSRTLLACYSADYPTRSACQHEFATAYLAGDAEGDPLRRVMAVNLERAVDHIEPRHLRDMLLPTMPTSPAALTSIVDAVAARVTATNGVIGAVAERPARWLGAQPVHPPSKFIGRWRELWWLHSALHPHIGPLTSPPTTPITVVHGPRGIGKTALAAEYVRRFGAAFPGGILWRSTTSGIAADAPSGNERCLWVLDVTDGASQDVAALLPPDPNTPCLVLTRDARLAKLGNALALADLTSGDSARLLAAHGLTDHAGTADLIAATAGSPELRARIAELAGKLGVDAALDRLHRPSSDVLSPLTSWLTNERDEISGYSEDVLRVLAAASPATVSILRIADVLATVSGTDRLHEIVSVQHAVTELVSRGVVPAAPDAVELILPSALVLAVHRIEQDPHRAERIRAATMRALARQGRSTVPDQPTRRPHHAYTDEELRASHRIRTELLNRITGHPLPQGQGSLREALSSLHRLLDIVRTTQGSIHPAALYPSPPGPSLGDITHHLINDVLRTTLTQWHVELSAHEDLRPPGTSRIEFERTWSRHDELRQALHAVHLRAVDIVNELGAITGSPPIHETNHR